MHIIIYTHAIVSTAKDYVNVCFSLAIMYDCTSHLVVVLYIILVRWYYVGHYLSLHYKYSS